MRCLSCNYDLRELSTGNEHRCPECGRIFDPQDPRTFLPPLTRWRPRTWIILILVGLMLLAFLLGWMQTAMDQPLPTRPFQQRGTIIY